VNEAKAKIEVGEAQEGTSETGKGGAVEGQNRVFSRDHSDFSKGPIRKIAKKALHGYFAWCGVLGLNLGLNSRNC